MIDVAEFIYNEICKHLYHQAYISLIKKAVFPARLEREIFGKLDRLSREIENCVDGELTEPQPMVESEVQHEQRRTS